ncbi:MAG TPA: hypothetical protein VFA95_06220 [Gammaproteobacteria bacterium]|nr:hypothetical protein [Gammaproteobacteria bacterium]
MYKILRSSLAVAVLAVPLAAFAQGDGFGMPARNGVQLPVVKNMPSVSFSWKADSKTSLFHNRGAGLAKGSTTYGETEGLRELAHLGVDAKAGSASFHAGAILQGYEWTGNAHGADTPAYPNQVTGISSNAIRLDYAYMETPIADGWIFSAGRQIVNWGYCFTACDTRRDRLKLVKVINPHWVYVTLWDKRDAQTLRSAANSNYPVGDYRSGYMWLNGFVANFEPGMDSAIHIGSFISIFRGNSATGANANAANSTVGSGFALRGVDLWSSWARGHVQGWQYLANLNVTKNGSVLWPDTSEAYALRVAHDLASPKWNLAGQYIGVHNGGLISSGYDTFSSMVNNSPAMDTSPTNVTNLGGTGIKGVSQYKQWMAMVRLSWMPTQKWTLNLAGGRMHRDGSAGALNFAQGTTENDNVVDVQAHYQISPNVRTWATWGMLDPTNSGTAPMFQGTGYTGSSIQAVSLNVQAVF